MRPALPLHALVVHQSHVGLIHQSRGLETMASTLTSHVAPREAPQFVVDDGRQPVECAPVSIAPCAEKLAHVRRRRFPRMLVCCPRHDLIGGIIAPNRQTVFALAQCAEPRPSSLPRDASTANRNGRLYVTLGGIILSGGNVNLLIPGVGGIMV